VKIDDPMAFVAHRLRLRAACKLMFSPDPIERDLGRLRIALLEARERRAEREGVFPPPSAER
jgi:hypothetical protein